MATISTYIFNVISDLNDNGKLAFRKTKNESEETPRFKVGLGVIPDYMYDGKGMRVDGVSEDKPAIKAGIKKGDIVIELGGNKVTDMMSYMKALSVYKAGDKTTVVLTRNGKEVKADIQF
jgi:S1-C subfamily serine protease